MKLYLNETSPFSRVVTITAVLAHCKDLEFVWVDPWQSPEALLRVNPFCTIPALVLNDGIVLTESLCICQYLIAKFLPTHLYLVDHDKNEQVAIMGFAKTMMETAFRTVAIKRFVSGECQWSQRGNLGLARSLNKLEMELGTIKNQLFLLPNLASLYLQVALEYVQFRHPEIFCDHAGRNTLLLIEHSPFHDVMTAVSLIKLSEKPNFSSLLMT